MKLETLSSPGTRWPASDKEKHASAVRTIAQAAVNVELFTIPLYMATLYSIRGTHPITGKNNFYKGRRWPGLATTAPTADRPLTANEQAFNLVFSVFVARDAAPPDGRQHRSTLGVAPTFTSSLLQNHDHGWNCYGPTKTVIPHIVDLGHTRLQRRQGGHRRAESHPTRSVHGHRAARRQARAAEDHRKMPSRAQYFPNVPFDGWTTEKTEVDLPMFGTIGWMYQCYFDYMKLPATTTARTLLDHVFSPGSQRDMFNVESDSHPRPEFAKFDAALAHSTSPARRSARSST